MSLRDDDRAVTVQIGAVLLLGFLVVALSLYQVTVVTEQNERVEFRHNERVQADMLDVRDAVVTAGTAGGVRPVSVELGTRYPARAVFVNPPPPSGTIGTVGLGAVAVDNAAAATAGGEVATASDAYDFWNGSVRTYETVAIRYRPSYSEYRNAPTTVYENTVVYNVYDDGATVALTDQTLVDGRSLSLVTLGGELSVGSSRTVSLSPRAVSAATRTVRVTNAAATENLRVAIPTGLDAEAWTTLLADSGEFDADGCAVDDGDGRYVCDVADPDPADGTVTLVFQRGATYSLRMAKVGVGTGAGEPDPAYVVVADAPASVVPNQRATLTVEVRDAYNNPTGATLRRSEPRGTLELRDGSAPGVFRFEYVAPEMNGNDPLRFSTASVVSNFDPAVDPDDARVDVQVQAIPGTDVADGDADSDAVNLSKVTLSDRSTNQRVIASYDLEASDSDGDGDLTELKIELIDGGGSVVASDSVAPGAGQPTLALTGEFDAARTDGPYHLRITARDADGAIEEEIRVL
jgi:hypothetical protein